MAVFYRGPRVLITHTVFAVDETCRRRYAIDDLEDVRIVREAPAQCPSGPRTLAVSGLIAVLATVPVVGRVSVLLVILMTAVAAVYLALCVRESRRARWSLVAVHNGLVKVLFTSDDRQEFDQVCRGLQRSLERRNSG